MAYTITFWRGVEDVKSTPWLGLFESAQVRADAQLETLKLELGATHVTESDERTGMVVYTMEAWPNHASLSLAVD